jgi:hypothetical protein
MPRETYIFRDGMALLKGSPEEVSTRGKSAKRSHLSAPMIISDCINDVMNPVDGRVYDSKSSYYAAVKASGCEIIGGDPIRTNVDNESTRPIHDVEASVATALEQLS